MRQVWYHAGCWDGFGAAWACNRFLQVDRFVPVNYGQPPPPYDHGDSIWIVDFSFPLDVMLALSASVTLRVIDHHASAEEAVRLVGGTFDSTKSGAVLTWEAVSQEPVPALLLYVQDRDLWAWKEPYSRDIQWLVRSLRPDFKEWEGAAVRFESESPEQLRSAALNVSGFVRCQIEEAIKHAWKSTLAGHEVFMLNATLLTSDICDALIQDGAKVAAYFTVGADDRKRWGIRSKNGEALEIARLMGGGGHPNAAGFVEPAP